jgi:hypothetical protein
MEIPGPQAPAAGNRQQKQTLLGIAPIIVVGPSSTERSSSRPPPSAAAAPPPPSAPSSEQPSATSTAPFPAIVAPAEPSSSPTATSVTTPSKRYVPKDGAATPAVVISEGAQAGDAAGARAARHALTLPGHARSHPAAAPAPHGGFGAVKASAPPTSSSLDDTYPPLRRTSSKLPLILGGVALAGAAAFAFSKLSAKSELAPPAPPSTERTVTVAPPVAEPPPAPTPTLEAPSPIATTPEEPSAQPSEAAAEPAPSAGEAPPPPEAASQAAKTPKKVLPAPAASPVRRPVTRAEPKAATPSATQPQPATKAGKGVIVRETPF